jgi:hypothetical protein
LKAYDDIMRQDVNLNAKQKAAQDVLKNERVLDNTQRVEVTNRFETMRPDELRDLFMRAARVQEPVIDVEIVSEDDEENKQ